MKRVLVAIFALNVVLVSVSIGQCEGKCASGLRFECGAAVSSDSAAASENANDSGAGCHARSDRMPKQPLADSTCMHGSHYRHLCVPALKASLMLKPLALRETPAALVLNRPELQFETPLNTNGHAPPGTSHASEIPALLSLRI